ncbi:hypothetical protein JJQ72_16910 [Paenibacillus sp. F411]|uniref:hypothetical protein n=1 Tax=unclassified Paenibacillus TaxID=185978 RepID=UPI001AAFEF71|nr:hypothetical protein [Paenibacillus sp. F411]MBO2945660.1 hypothetical protein [Paenibacillus sp. F411]
MSGHQHYYHHPRNASSRSLNESLPASSYPGVEAQAYPDYSADAGTSAYYPYSVPAQPSIAPMEPMSSLPAVTTPQPAAETGSSSGLAGLLGGLNLSNLDLKGMIERMGGVEGLVANIGKVQKVMQSVQQLAPMMAVFSNLLSKKGSDSDAVSPGGYDTEYVPRRRRTRRRKKTGSRRKGTGKRKRS